MVLIEGSVPQKAAGWQARSPLFEIALVLVRCDHVASVIVNADHSATAVVDCVSQLRDATRLTQFSRLWESARAEREQPSLNPTGRLGVSTRTSTQLVEFLPSIFRIWAPS